METKYGTRAEVVNETTVFIPLNHNANIAYLSESKGITKLQASNLISKNKTSGIVTRGQDTIIREGIMLKSFALVSGTNENCTVVATINVALEEYIPTHTKRFIAVYSSAVIMKESGKFTWTQGSNSATLNNSTGKITLLSAGTIDGTISYSASLAATYKAAGFSVSGSKNYTVRRLYTINFKFDPNYAGGILN